MVGSDRDLVPLKSRRLYDPDWFAMLKGKIKPPSCLLMTSLGGKVY